MVAFKISYKDVVSLLKIDQNTTIEVLDNLFSYGKCEIEDFDLEDDLIKVDCKTSNRPDLWGVEGLVREVSGITGIAEGLPDLSTEPSGYILEVDANIKSIRPFIACSIVRGLRFDDFLIKQLIQLQEKVDLSYGRRRRRSSIGIYNVEMLKSPIYYGLIPRNSSFIPLGYDEPFTLDEILSKHPKGVEYRNILPKKGKLPILRDAEGTVLSMPPIINSNDVGRVTEETTDVLVEVTGTKLEVVKVVNTLITQALRDRGGRIYSVEVKYSPDHNGTPEIMVTPEVEPYIIKVNPKNIERYLNLKLKSNDMVKLLRKRRFEAEIQKNSLIVKYPPYRVDLLHWVDIAEEIAIAYGYMNIKPTDWKIMTIGKLSPRTISENYVREILSGCTLQEVLTFTLTAPEKLTTMMGYEDNLLSECVEVSNPVSLNYSVIRNRLIPGLYDFLSKNTHNEYPQYIFEVGEVISLNAKKEVETTVNAAVALSDTEISFEHCHSILETLFRSLNTEFKLKPIESTEFIKGRTAQIMTDGRIAGIIGEINPELLENWQVFMPTAAFEISLSLIPTLNLPPLLTFEK
ncbi:MAG: phenylalanine--tRNA ligase subunit beta [Candidatus Hodarchaeales archaeon]|jgi:phenylalanyl-tRNA synthetase beta chain